MMMMMVSTITDPDEEDAGSVVVEPATSMAGAERKKLTQVRL